MLKPKAQLSLKNARDYFREHLCVGDYYAAGHTISGEWLGQGAAQLGLTGTVGKKAFLALCDGQHPLTGQRLTLRMNSVRREGGRDAANRRIFYDFTISPPKSVSVVALYQDPRVIELHNRAVSLAMTELEAFAETRVRRAGQNAERVTGQMVAACFRHDTSRELDPHLHTHCVVFNATFDPVESRWKALHASGMYRAQKFAENYYYHELAKGLRSLGYEIENNTRDFEIRGVPASVVARFSKRHEQIEQEAERQIKQAGGCDNVAALRERIAQDKRRRKLQDSTADRLRPHWERQLTPAEKAALASLRNPLPRPPPPANVADIVAWAEQHLFERRSVVQDYELISAALARGRGNELTLSDLNHHLGNGAYVRAPGTRKLTSREVLDCELEIVLAAHDGRRRHAALNPAYEPSPALSAEQTTAVRRILSSRDFITLFRGGAGTGKSFTLKEVERGLTVANRPVVILAPQRQQVRDLQADGLPADTVAHALAVRTLPAGAVVIVDEAGQLGGRELRDVIRMTKAHGGRLLLSGDTRQHGAVAASDALRAIEEHAGLKPAHIRSIRRQDPKLGTTLKERAFIRAYRDAVKAAASGEMLDSFERLDRLGCVQELAPDERRSTLAAHYLVAIDRKERVLVVGQTREEVRGVNEAIREQLKAGGQLGAETVLTAYRPFDLDEAQRHDARFYQPGQHVRFLKRYGRFVKGDLCEVVGATDVGVVILKHGRRSTLSYRYADRLAVTAPVEMRIAAGDRLQLKLNGRSTEGLPLNNGELVTVRRVLASGDMIVEDDAGVRKTLAPHQRLFLRGYAVTSYGSQGKTVDTILFSDASNRAATSRNQWYVAISRARKRAMIFTSDVNELRANIQRSGDRELALSLKPDAIVQAERPHFTKAIRQSMAAAAHLRVHRAILKRIQGLHRHRRVAP